MTNQTACNTKTPAIFAASLRKSYREKTVLRNVSFTVPHGSIYTLLGSNGAGKTTTIRILTTQLLPDGGEILLEGHSLTKEPGQIRKIISLTGQFSAIDESLTGKENLIIMGRLRHLPDPEASARRLLSYFELSSCENRIAATYSGGMKRKLDIAMSLLGDPHIIFLDEPTTGLDPQSRRAMWRIIRRLKDSGVTIFLTTQYLDEAEELSDTIAILDKGEIIAEGTPTELKAYLPRGVLQFHFEKKDELTKAAALLSNYKTCTAPEQDALLTVYTDGSAAALSEIFHIFHCSDIPVKEFSQLTPKLEDVFLTMIKKNEEN